MDYYYWAKALEAGEQGDMASHDYYMDLASKEERAYWEIWPDYGDALK